MTTSEPSHQGRGLAIGDLDNDGRPDLVISHVNEPVTVLRNIGVQEHRWIGVALRDKDNKDIVGASVTVEVGGRTLTRIAKSGGSYLSSNDRRLLFGLGVNDKPVRLKVKWPSGQEQFWDDLALDRYWQLTEK